MSAITQAFYDRLSGDATLQGLLAQYPAASGNAAVFTIDPVPGDATLPYIVTSGEVTHEGFDSLSGDTGRDLLRDIRCYASADGSVATIETIAERVRALFHHTSFSVAGFTQLFSSVSGPIALNEEDIYGRVLTVRLVLEG